ncbi:MAG TPA: type II toxin-antitoxin system HicB family antitoxin [Conexibacter sp.]|nr:type II toxin-antitoxin system HicB family antitoxin [Conexibacter sp.]
MAKVMISLPDNLLERIDAHVQAHRTNRSAFLQDAAERMLVIEDAERAERIRKLLANPGHHGGNTVEFIKQMRRER